MDTKNTAKLAKRIAHAGLCSRRDAEALILEGRVTVNDQVVDKVATRVTAQDAISVDNTPLPDPESPRVWLLHKPTGFITSKKDSLRRPLVFGLLPDDFPLVHVIGRLDFNSEGLLLLTNHAPLKRAMELPISNVPRSYRVRVFGQVEDAALDQLRKGITVDDMHYAPMQVEREANASGKNSWLRFTLTEGKNREIRNACAAINLQVNRLIRTNYGLFTLDDLPRAQYTEATAQQVITQCQQIGLT